MYVGSSLGGQLRACWEAVGTSKSAPFMLLYEAEYVLKYVCLKVVDVQAMGACNNGPLPAPCTLHTGQCQCLGLIYQRFLD